MVQSCISIGCKNRGKINGVTYHRFPKNEELRRQWVNAVKIKDWSPTQHSRICSAHFREMDLDRTSLAVVRIREGAIPAIFPEFNKVKDRRPLKRIYANMSEPEPVNCNESHEKKLKTELISVRAVLKRKDLKIKSLQLSKRRLQKKVAKLEDILDCLRNKMNIEEEACTLLGSISKTSDCLIKRSVEKTLKPTLKKTYDDRLKTFAITLHFLSPKAYCYVRKTFNTSLPHPRTLRRWYSSVNAEPGFSKEVFRALKEHAEKSAVKPICSLMLDCMSIKKHLEWDGKRFHGTINTCGNVSMCDDSAPLASEALVLHLVFINDCWKIPLGHFFVNGISGQQLSSLVEQCLNLLHDSNIHVASLTCDGTASNIAMANILGCSIDPNQLTCTFPHPTTKDQIHFFLDPSHMIKLVRNTLGDGKVMLNSKGEKIEWSYIEKLYRLQTDEGLHLGNKLTSSHINFVRQKMKVKLATQLLSRSVADSLEYLLLNKVPGFEGCSATIEFIRLFDKLFDILNSRSIRAKYEKQALYEKNFKTHSEFLLQAKSYISQLKNAYGVPILASRRKTGFIGMIVCIESTLKMYQKYVNGAEKPLKYLPMYKVSQDHLERLFGYIRSRGGHNNNPSCKEFTGSFKRILLHKELQETNSGNTLVLNKALIFDINRKRNEIEEINSSTPGWRSLNEDDVQVLERSYDDDVEDEFIDILSITTDIACDIIEYVAGYVVKSLKPKIICKTCVNLMIGNDSDSLNLISCKNRGGLIQPSEGVKKLCSLCESVFRYFSASGAITKTSNINERLVANVLRRCIHVNLFPNEHFFEQEPEQNHLILLIKAIAKKFFTVRLHHYSKCLNETLHKNKLRSHLTKVVTFLGQ